MTQPGGLFSPCPLFLFGLRVRHQTSLLGNCSPDCRRGMRREGGRAGDDVRTREEDEERRHRQTYVRETERAGGEHQRGGGGVEGRGVRTGRSHD